jgi:hypothetical protein
MRKVIAGLVVSVFAGAGGFVGMARYQAPATYQLQVSGLMSIGNGSLHATYSQEGAVVTVEVDFQAGPTTRYQPNQFFGFSLPVAPLAGTTPVFAVYVSDDHGILPATTRGGQVFVSQMFSNASMWHLSTSEMGPASVVTISGTYLAG